RCPIIEIQRSPIQPHEPDFKMDGDPAFFEEVFQVLPNFWPASRQNTFLVADKMKACPVSNPHRAQVVIEVHEDLHRRAIARGIAGTHPSEYLPAREFEQCFPRLQDSSWIAHRIGELARAGENLIRVTRARRQDQIIKVTAPALANNFV